MCVLVDARGVRKRYANGAACVEVLRGIDLRVDAGEMVSIVGPSGCGKSTLLYCLAGLEHPDAGEVHLVGKDIVRARRGELTRWRARHIGFVFQRYNLVPALSVGENVSLPARLAGKRLSRNAVGEVLTRVGMGGRDRERPVNLSGGEAQRVAIARAMASDPRIVFADEPTGALDTENGKAVLSLLHGLTDGGGRSVVMVTHDLEAAARADRVLVMRDGVIERELLHPTPREILAVMEGLASIQATEGTVRR